MTQIHGRQCWVGTHALKELAPVKHRETNTQASQYGRHANLASIIQKEGQAYREFPD